MMEDDDDDDDDQLMRRRAKRGEGNRWADVRRGEAEWGWDSA